MDGSPSCFGRSQVQVQIRPIFAEIFRGCTYGPSNPSGWKTFPVVQTGAEAHTPSCTKDIGSFQRETWIGRGGLHPPLSSYDGANGLEVNLRLPSTPEKGCHALTFIFTYNLKKNVEIFQNGKYLCVKMSQSAFKILNDTCSCISVNNPLLIIGLRIRVLWDVMACSYVTAASVSKASSPFETPVTSNQAKYRHIWNHNKYRVETLYSDTSANE